MPEERAQSETEGEPTPARELQHIQVAVYVPLEVIVGREADERVGDRVAGGPETKARANTTEGSDKECTPDLFVLRAKTSS